MWVANPLPREGQRAEAKSGITGISALPSAPAQLVAIQPCRIIDTRPGAAAAYLPNNPLPGNVVVTFDLNSAPAPCNNIPSTAVAYSINVTIVAGASGGYLSVFAGSTAPNPLTSLLDYAPGEVIANASAVPGDANGMVGFLSSSSINVVVDINGYYVPPAPSQTLYYAVLSSVLTGTFAQGPVPWIDSINSAGPAATTLTVNPSTFAKYPICHCSPLNYSPNGVWWCSATPHGAPDLNGNFANGQWGPQNYKIETYGGTNGAVNMPFMLTCYAQN
jgi:hypothetical protein